MTSSRAPDAVPVTWACVCCAVAAVLSRSSGLASVRIVDERKNFFISIALATGAPQIVCGLNGTDHLSRDQKQTQCIQPHAFVPITARLQAQKSIYSEPRVNRQRTIRGCTVSSCRV